MKTLDCYGTRCRLAVVFVISGALVLTLALTDRIFFIFITIIIIISWTVFVCLCKVYRAQSLAISLDRTMQPSLILRSGRSAWKGQSLLQVNGNL